MDRLNDDAQALSPLPPVLDSGLVAVTFFAFLSFFSSTGLFAWLTFKLLRRRFSASSSAAGPTNQFLLLVYNLVFADIQQAIAFLLNVHSLRVGAIDVGTAQCWAQGWFVSTGDLASSLFILAIAVHTFFAVVRNAKLPQWALWLCIALLWLFNYLMAVVPVVQHPDDLFVRAGAWCWINAAYRLERLWFHYFWIFLAMFVTFLIYLSIYIIITVRSRSAVLVNPMAQPPHALPLMIIYPSIYIVCTTPLAAGRLAAMAGTEVSLAYYCVAGSMIACNGWLDVLLYSWTRRGIVFGEDPCTEAYGFDTFTMVGNFGKERGMGTTTTIEGGANAARASEEGRVPLGVKRGRRGVSSSSTENFFRLESGGDDDNKNNRANGIGIKTETTVQVSSAGESFEMEQPGRVRSSRSRSCSRSRPHPAQTSRPENGSWETKSGASYDEL